MVSVDLVEMGITRISNDKDVEAVEFGCHLLELGRSLEAAHNL